MTRERHPGERFCRHSDFLNGLKHVAFSRFAFVTRMQRTRHPGPLPGSPPLNPGYVLEIKPLSIIHRKKMRAERLAITLVTPHLY
jgi:hypothetical protein